MRLQVTLQATDVADPAAAAGSGTPIWTAHFQVPSVAVPVPAQVSGSGVPENTVAVHSAAPKTVCPRTHFDVPVAAPPSVPLTVTVTARFDRLRVHLAR